MFTGIVERTARIVELVPSGPGGDEGLTLRLEAEIGDHLPPWKEPALGESIAVDGVCLTVVAARGHHLEFTAVPETLGLTTLGAREVGDRVNLEQALAVGDRFGGHFVTGHVDGMGKVVGRVVEGDQEVFTISAPAHLIEQMLRKGSITVDGVSLTLVEVNREAGWFSFAAIPHTLQITALGERGPGSAVNLETDAYGKWILHGLKEIFRGEKKREDLGL